MTGWQYPNFQWAMSHVPGIPSRCLVTPRGGDDLRRLMVMPDGLCPDPIRHVNQFLASRGQPIIPLTALHSSGDPEGDPTEDDTTSRPEDA